jgi:RND family efflux transporter MFP subunit
MSQAASSATPASPQILRQAQDARSFLAQWLLLLVARSPGLQTALVLSLDDSGALVPAAMWPETIGDVSELVGPAQRCADERRDVVLPLADGPRAQPRCALASPIFSDDRLVAAVVLVSHRTAEADTRRLLAEIHWGAGWVDALYRQRLKEDHSGGLARARHALDMLALLAGHDRVDDACAAMAAELARVSGCERVAVGLAQDGRVSLSALSHAAWFEQRSTLASQIESAMNEAVEQRATLTWPGAGDRSLIVQAQKTLAGEQAALTIPILAGTRAVGAVSWQLGTKELTPEFIAQGEALAVVLAPLLARLADQSRWWAGKGPALITQGWRAVRDPRRPAFAVAAVLAVAVLAGITLIDTTYRVPAKASLEGQVQRVIAAPFEGFVLEAPARAGQTVARGALLARLDDRDLKLEQARLTAELNQQERKRDEALARHERSELSVLSAQVAETEAKLNQVEERLTRTRIEAPFDGVLVSGDLSQSIGSPVEQGKSLFELAPLKGYRVALKVDERDVREIKPGQQGELVLSGMAGDKLPFTVRHVSVAGVEDGQNLFRVEADLAAQDQRLRPGMEGVGKVNASQHPLLWIWTHRFVDWLRLTWWRYLP